MSFSGRSLCVPSSFFGGSSVESDCPGACCYAPRVMWVRGLTLSALFGRSDPYCLLEQHLGSFFPLCWKTGTFLLCRLLRCGEPLCFCLAGRPYRPLPRAIPLTGVQSVLFAGTSAWPTPYGVRKGSSTAVTLPPQVSFGPQGAQRMKEKVEQEKGWLAPTKPTSQQTHPRVVFVKNYP